MTSMIRAALDGKVEPARDQHRALRPLFEALFFESNPIPVKAALAMADRLQENYRLPLCKMGGETRERLQGVLEKGGWL